MFVNTEPYFDFRVSSHLGVVHYICVYTRLEGFETFFGGFGVLATAASIESGITEYGFRPTLASFEERNVRFLFLAYSDKRGKKHENQE